MDRHQVEENIRSLVQRRAETQERLRQSEQRLAELEDEHRELQGALALNARAIADMDVRAEQLEQELRLAETEDARVAVEKAVQAREAAAERAAHAARELRAAHDHLEETRQGVENARAALQKLDHRAAALAEPEPRTFEDEWHSLAPLVEQELNTQLEVQIVAAAVASNNPLDMEALPDHLQVLARARRNDLLRRR
jgi:chromosome segregation ATPase